MSLTRRALIGYGGTAAAAVALGQLSWLVNNDETLLRPPGAQDTGHLFAACIKCDRCRSVCPTDIVVMSTLEEGIVSARTPKLDFHKGICTFCDLCLQVCPTGAIRPFDETREKIGIAVVQPDRCLAYTSGCRICVDACQYQAMHLNENGIPIVDASLCNGCGECEYVCPALVYRSFPGGKKRGIIVVTEQEYEAANAAGSSSENEG